MHGVFKAASTPLLGLYSKFRFSWFLPILSSLFDSSFVLLFSVPLSPLFVAPLLSPFPQVLAARTKNFSGAEIEGLVKSASSFAFYSSIDVLKNKVTPKADYYKNMKVTMEHFEQALKECTPAFGVAAEELKMAQLNGIIEYSPEFTHLRDAAMTLVRQVQQSDSTPILSVLLEGSNGTGKTALAAHIAQQSGFPYTKLISPENLVGYSEYNKSNKIIKVFEDAYKSPVSMIILDDIERLLEYVQIGPRFSNAVLQTLLVLIKRIPPKEGHRVMVIGTTNNLSLLEDLQFRQSFNVVWKVPKVHKADSVRAVFQERMASKVDQKEVENISQHIEGDMDCHLGIKQLLMVMEMAVQGRDKITADRFFECMADCGLSSIKMGNHM